MIGLDGRRVYLDWNATAPLRPEARAAMLAAMDAVGNPSSVHAEGRAARAILERARTQVARLVACDPSEIVFTSGATEAAATVMQGEVVGTEIEHDCVLAHIDREPTRHLWSREHLRVTPAGRVGLTSAGRHSLEARPEIVMALQLANSETGVVQDPDGLGLEPRRLICDAVQAYGKLPPERTAVTAAYRLASAHKLGGPKGAGALVARRESHSGALIPGGGQESGRRSGTENVIGIAGFGAAAEAALRDLEAGVWDRVEKLRNILEDALAAAAPETIFFGQESGRLPNTSCFAVPGWKGETQVMQMDLAGFAVSAGSACSSGKMRESRALRAMGYDTETASSAIRVSMGPTTTETEVLAFADAWTQAHRKRRARAA